MSETIKRQNTFEGDKSLVEYQNELSSITFPFSPSDIGIYRLSYVTFRR